MTPESPSEPTPRDFTDRSWQASMTDEELARVVREGKGSMPSFAGVLGDTEVRAALESVRSFGR